MTFLDVGQGDATLIEAPSGQVVLIDGGGHPGTDEREGTDPGTRVVIPYLRSRGISTVDWLVPTHPDDDHVQGLVSVVRRLRVRAALDGGVPDDAGPCYRLRAELAARRIPTFPARRGQRLDLGGGAFLEIVHPGAVPLSGTRSDANENSIVMRLCYGRTRVLLTGDAGGEAEAALLRAGIDLRADVLKLGHHGSRHSSTPAFLGAVRPQAAVVSCGRRNRFGHPHHEVLRRLGEVPLFRTDRQGAIVLESDGSTIRMHSTRNDDTPAR